jgi:hypothetical protein
MGENIRENIMKKNSYVILLLTAILCALCLTSCLSDNTDALVEDYYKEGISEDGFEFIIGNNKASIIRYTGSLTEVSVPAEIEGYPVTWLERTFENNQTIVSVALPGNIEHIDTAFKGCLNLSNISLSEGMDKIPSDAFGGCSSLSKVVIPSTLKKIGARAFAECTALTDINFPVGLTEIGAGAFVECTALTEVNLPAAIRIDSNAFENTPWLNSMTGDFIVIGGSLVKINLDDTHKHIDIPDNVKYVGLNEPIGFMESVFFPKGLREMGNILYGTKNLKSITVDENNPEYSSVDGVLYNKDKTILMYYPENKEGKVFEADENVKMIFNWACWSQAETIILPEDFLTDFNSLIIILQNYKPMSKFNFETRKDSVPEDYWRLAFAFVSHNGSHKKIHEPHFDNLYFRAAAPSDVEEINAYLKKLDSTLNIVWGYEGQE